MQNLKNRIHKYFKKSSAKKSHPITRLFVATSFLWVAGQMFSFDNRVDTVSANILASRIADTWKDLKAKNLISGSILIQQGSQVLYSDGSLTKHYPIASISKSFVGMMYYEQAKRKNLSLQTPVCHWLKNFCVGKLQQITLQHLLDHKGGFGRDLGILSFLKRTFNDDWQLQDIDTLVLADTDLLRSPGETFDYSNFGFLVLSRILEIHSGRRFSELVAELASKTNMTSTSAISKQDSFPVKGLIPYMDISGNMDSKRSLHILAGTGGIQSTAYDLIKWLEYAQESGIIEKLDKSKLFYTHGWVKTESQSYKGYWHNGSTPGFYSLVAHVPQSDLKVVILMDSYKFIKQWAEKTEVFEQYFY
ncbi:serine hydrolase domain-containing protein [Bdellovibrio reynosensis]|uniref:Beta-lactamase family protein n=1 Tax=Bdellovibrio reynosensis TaxID=2835041 RepID=A0ABY4C8U2_9BACT|nr:serine hydrolase domain-containing protein [Bdellovibrio reynosensis]UOF01347.1 beta-lactamase family protein [Bdellovibrio reynosensis]